MGRRPGGGRAGRMAMRAETPPPNQRPVRPGMSGGAFKPLSDNELRQVYESALDLLESVGMGSPVPAFIEVVTAAGGWVEGDRLHYPRAVVEAAIETAAKSFVWHGIDEERSIDVGGDRVHFGTAGAAVLMLDHETKAFRHSTSLDLYDVARLADTLEHIHFFVRTVVTRDLVEARDVDINTAYVTMAGTTKPIGTSFFHADHVYEAVEMFDMFLGGEGEFRKRPFVVANNTFVVPPLRFAQDSADAMVAQVRTGMPINLLSAGQAGATSPAALAGSLVQALAECLAALTSVNLLQPGHPCVMGLWPFVSDLRTGAMTGGSGEEAILNAAAAQVANYLGLPSGVAAGMADAKIPDGQAGYEKGVTVTLAGQAGANLVYESAGMLGSLLGCSLEMMVIDNDMLGSVNRTIRGIEVNEDTLSAEVIRQVVQHPGHFLGHEQTLGLMERDYVYPLVADRDTPANWADNGSLDATDRAHMYVEKTLASHYPDHIPPEVDAQIRARFPIAIDNKDMTEASTRW